jgi:all-trans-8'-apo-beta-carotenal 15,15'-oxygenase
MMKNLAKTICFVTTFTSLHAWGSNPSFGKRDVTSQKMTMTTTTTTPTTIIDESVAVKSDRAISNTGHDLEAWKNGFTTCPKEYPPTVLDFPDLPADFPLGTYYRNGHGRFESQDGVRVQHPFDGDGLISAITFDTNRKQILFRNRFVRTDGYRKDISTGTMSAPGVFGTRVSGGFFKNLFRQDFKNVANTHVLYSPVEKKLYALWEAGWPYRLDPLTLENDVIKEPQGYDMNGLLKKGQTLAAHYRYDPKSDTYADFSNTLNPTDGTTTIRLFEFDAKTMEPKWSEQKDTIVSAVFEGCGVLHDFAITENWCIFSIPPAKVNSAAAIKALLGFGAFAGVIDFQNDSDEAMIVCIPRIKHLLSSSADTNSVTSMKIGEDERIKIINAPYHFTFHFANAFEDSGTYLVLFLLSAYNIL